MLKTIRRILSLAAVFVVGGAQFARNAAAQAAPQKPAQKATEKPAEAAIPAQIELLETKYRFEVSGDSRKEVHARVKINSELGVRQFARLNFDYNRSFQTVEIPLVRITHASGGIADILPSAITDQPNPAVVDAPAYQDVRVKSVRILGLQPADLLEYRVVTTTTHHPLAPDFWVEHNFDRTGVVSHEVFELDFPRKLTEQNNNRSTSLRSTYMGNPTITSSLDGDERRSYRWERSTPDSAARSSPENSSEPDVLFSSIADWPAFSNCLAELLLDRKNEGLDETMARLRTLIPGAKSANEIMRAGYEFTSQKLRTVDLPLGASGFHIRRVKDIVDSGYATPEEKCSVLALFADMAGFQRALLLAGALEENRRQIVRPSVFNHAFLAVTEKKRFYALDPSLEVAPYGLVPPQFRGKLALRVPPYAADDYVDDPWNASVPEDLPFPASQRVDVNAVLGGDGKLTAKVKYLLRGDNELLLRVAFHQTPKEKLQEIAQYLALSDGFRGKVTSVKTSDPYATKDPFTVEYEIEQEKFVNWAKKPVRIPALLPLPGLPDPPRNGGSGTKIELGTPLDVELSATLRLPAGTTAQTPTGTAVKRDYATFSSEYSAKDNVIRASRHLNFLLREIPGERATDYNAFLHAVQNDQAQIFTLERVEPAAKAGATQQ